MRLVDRVLTGTVSAVVTTGLDNAKDIWNWPARAIKARFDWATRAFEKLLFGTRVIDRAVLVWMESFVFAGTSALLLLLARFYPTYWFLSFIALTPFLARIYRADLKESLRLGFLFGVTFFLFSELAVPPVSLSASLTDILIGTAVFAGFGGLVGWTRQKLGFNAVIVAVLWVLFEAGLIELGLVTSLLSGADFSGGFIHALVVVFGFLLISFLIVLLNAIVVSLIDRALAKARARRLLPSECGESWDLVFTSGPFADKFFLLPEGRGPPSLV